jgi:hypothetical protein
MRPPIRQSRSERVSSLGPEAVFERGLEVVPRLRHFPDGYESFASVPWGMESLLCLHTPRNCECRTNCVLLGLARSVEGDHEDRVSSTLAHYRVSVAAARCNPKRESGAADHSDAVFQTIEFCEG